ncbi:MAG: helix-turn-helix transcriptional regulator [Christensenellales bacterium]|jgi:transcriptional regulator with XRE-family HTH domain
MPNDRSKEKAPAGFEHFGRDLKEARNILKLSRSALAEKVGMDDRYLANIENSGYIPSLTLFCALVRACKLPIERYFYPDTGRRESSDHERLKLKMAYLSAYGRSRNKRSNQTG